MAAQKYSIAGLSQAAGQPLADATGRPADAAGQPLAAIRPPDDPVADSPTDPITEPGAEATRRAARFALIAKVSRIIAGNFHLESMLQQTADAIHEMLEYENVDVPLVDPLDEAFLIVRIRGGAYKESIRHEDRLPIDGGVMGAAIRERRTQLVNDVASDPRYVRPPSPGSARAELAIPILLGDTALGVLNVEGKGPYDDLDVISLEVIAGHLAVAIENTRLFGAARGAAVLEERQRLARDLHDSVTQMVASIQLLAQSLESAWRRDPAEGEKRARRLAEIAALAQAELRALLRELRPAPAKSVGRNSGRADVLPAGIQALRGGGLVAGLDRLLADVFDTGLQWRLDVVSYRPQPELVEEALYRVAQEAFANIAKHAAARVVRVVVAVVGAEVRLAIFDDGQGFVPQSKGGPSDSGGHSLGLVSMRERMQALGGGLTIRSRPGEGTHVEARVTAAEKSHA